MAAGAQRATARRAIPRGREDVRRLRTFIEEEKAMREKVERDGIPR
jgi:hypothetical protein